MSKKHYEKQVENKLVSTHNRYSTLAYFITNNFYVLQPSLEGKHVIIYNWCCFFKNVCDWLMKEVGYPTLVCLILGGVIAGGVGEMS